MSDERCCAQRRTGARLCPYAKVVASKIVSLNANWYNKRHRENKILPCPLVNDRLSVTDIYHYSNS